MMRGKWIAAVVLGLVTWATPALAADLKSMGEADIRALQAELRVPDREAVPEDPHRADIALVQRPADDQLLPDDINIRFDGIVGGLRAGRDRQAQADRADSQLTAPGSGAPGCRAPSMRYDPLRGSDLVHRRVSTSRLGRLAP